MADFVESIEHQLQTFLHNFSTAQHGKGPVDFEAGLLPFELIQTLIYSTLFKWLFATCLLGDGLIIDDCLLLLLLF